MRHCLVLLLLLVSFGVQALQSLRVGGQVLVVGDNAARVKALLGEPTVRGGEADSSASKSHKRPAKSTAKRGKTPSQAKGERWQYRRDNHTTTFTIIDGKIARIEDVAR